MFCARSTMVSISAFHEGTVKFSRGPGVDSRRAHIFYLIQRCTFDKFKKVLVRVRYRTVLLLISNVKRLNINVKLDPIFEISNCNNFPPNYPWESFNRWDRCPWAWSNNPIILFRRFKRLSCINRFANPDFFLPPTIEQMLVIRALWNPPHRSCIKIVRGT